MQLTKKSIISVLFMLVCLFIFSIFPVNDDLFQGMISALFFLLVIPALYIRIILRESLNSYGFQTGDWKKGLIFSGVSLVAALSIWYLFYAYTPFADNYRLSDLVRNDFGFFVFYELVLSGILVLLYETFFRGLIQFSLKDTKHWSVIIQLTIFIGFLGLTNNLDWNSIPFILIAVFSSIIAYKVNSIVYSLGFALILAIIIDTLMIGLS